MKLVVAIVQAEDAGALSRKLAEAGYRSTRINTAGGFLREGNATLLVGAADEQVDPIVELIGRCCHARKRQMPQPPPLVEPGEFPIQLPVEVEVGGATVFVLNVERSVRL